MNLDLRSGNIIEVPADVMIATANPWLEMTGGVNLAIILSDKGEDIYEELQKNLPNTKPKVVAPGTVLRTSGGTLPVKYILHAVAITPSYESTEELVTETIQKALNMAQECEAKTVTLSALATGFGPLSMEEFASALNPVLQYDWSPLENLIVVVKHSQEVEQIRNRLSRF